MARALIVGCGCHGRELGAELLDRGWAVRGTSRSDAGVAAIAAAGIDAVSADPDRVGTVLEQVADVTVLIWLLGSVAEGEDHSARALHTERLPSLLEKLVDTPVRGFAYEAVGSAGPEILDRGRGEVERAQSTWRLPVTLIESPRGSESWRVRVADQVEGLLSG